MVDHKPFTYLFLTSSFNCSVSSRSVEGKGEDVDVSGFCVELGMVPFNFNGAPEAAELATEGERGTKGETAILASKQSGGSCINEWQESFFHRPNRQSSSLILYASQIPAHHCTSTE